MLSVSNLTPELLQRLSSNTFEFTPRGLALMKAMVTMPEAPAEIPEAYKGIAETFAPTPPDNQQEGFPISAPEPTFEGFPISRPDVQQEGFPISTPEPTIEGFPIHGPDTQQEGFPITPPDKGLLVASREKEPPAEGGKVYYVGGNKEIDKFEPLGKWDDGTDKLGSHFTSEEGYAKIFAGKEGKVTKVRLDIKKPFITTNENMIEAPYSYTEYINDLKKQGYDAIILKKQRYGWDFTKQGNPWKGNTYHDQVFAFYPDKQAKVIHSKLSPTEGGKVEGGGIVWSGKTGMPHYDAHFDDTIVGEGLTRKEYYKKYKDMSGEIVNMSPEQYMELAAKGQWEANLTRNKRDWGSYDKFREFVLGKRISDLALDRLRKAVKKGNKIDIPVLEYQSKSGELLNQEGYHRAKLAQEMGIKEIPVMVVNNPKLFPTEGKQ